MLVAAGQLQQQGSQRHLGQDPGTCLGVAARPDGAGLLSLAEIGLGVDDKLVDESRGEVAAALEAPQHIGDEVGVALDMREMGEHGRGAARAEHLGLVGADLAENPFVAGLTQPGP